MSNFWVKLNKPVFALAPMADVTDVAFREKFYEAAKIIAALGFDGIDINFGCPQDKEIGQGTCAALIREPELAAEIISATKKGALLRRGYGGQAGNLPVSVKTRIGYSKPE